MALAWPVYRWAVLLMMSNVLFQCVVQSLSNIGCRLRYIIVCDYVRLVTCGKAVAVYE